MHDILPDTTKFKQLSSDLFKHTTNQENQLRSFLRNLMKDNVISKETYEHLAPSSSQPDIMYGLPKVHKINLPFRSILFAIRTHTYNLSKFLVSSLTPLLSSPFMISDTFSFLEEL